MTYDQLSGHFDDGWEPIMRPIVEGEEFDKVINHLKKESLAGKVICPEAPNLFRAFKECRFEDLKVIILLQDPYFSKRGGKIIADGLAMSCSITDYPQPSLVQFYRGMEKELAKGLDLHMYKDADLSYLAKQGVLLLNAALTVELEKKGSHAELWKPVTRQIVEGISRSEKQNLVWILMGSKAQEFEDNIPPFDHWILRTTHPAAASYAGGEWDSEGVFSRTNEILEKYNKVPEINWYQIVKDEEEVSPSVETKINEDGK